MGTQQLERRRIVWLGAVLLRLGAGLLLTAGCGALQNIASIIQPPRFEQDDRPVELRVITPSLANPAGGAAVTLWMRVTNPNPFGVTLSTLNATLTLEGSRAAASDFPFGLPLTAGEAAVVPIDLSISFADVPGLADALRQAATGRPVAYQLDGTVGIDAGRLGQPTFGPMMLASGDIGVSLASQRATQRVGRTPIASALVSALPDTQMR
jgi:hypothetical protein